MAGAGVIATLADPTCAGASRLIEGAFFPLAGSGRSFSIGGGGGVDDKANRAPPGIGIGVVRAARA